MNSSTIISHIPIKELQTEPSPCSCSYCGAKEGEAHPFRGFIVELTPVIGDPHSDPACQVCRIHFRKKAEFRKPGFIQKYMVRLVAVFMAVMVLLLFSEVLLAQPGLPSTPDQAPIDGGLGILAALGGGYAVKKLSARNKTAG